jgi:hypothetical protein
VICRDRRAWRAIRQGRSAIDLRRLWGEVDRDQGSVASCASSSMPRFSPRRSQAALTERNASPLWKLHSAYFANLRESHVHDFAGRHPACRAVNKEHLRSWNSTGCRQ